MNLQTYTPRPIPLEDVALPPELEELAELLAKNVHEVWAAGRIREGWRWGPERSVRDKTTPCLIPYEALPASEKAYDRSTAMDTLRLIQKLGYTIRRDPS